MTGFLYIRRRKQMLDYLRMFIERDNPLMEELEKSSRGRDDIQPSIEPELGKFLGLLVRLTGAKRVLEIGSGIGYSALWLAEAVKETGGRLVTVDNHERTHKEVVANIEKAGLSEYVEIVLGEGEDIVPSLDPGWDIVFQDGGKYLYPVLFEDIINLTSKGGLIIADDTLFRVNNTVRKRLGLYTDEYNRMVFSDPRLYSVILPVGHGCTVSYKL